MAKLRKVALSLAAYYCDIWSRSDRMATALSAFWSAMCTPYPDQSFVSFTTVLEALCNTGSDEISHQIAERVAAVLGRRGSERKCQYEATKSLYGLRSRLTHGQITRPRGKPLNLATIWMMAGRTNIADAETQKMSELAAQVILGVIADADLMRAIQSNNSSKLQDAWLAKLFE